MEEEKKAEWVERAQCASVRGGGEAMNPEQVNTAADRHGLSDCLSPVAQRCIHWSQGDSRGQPTLRQSGQARPT